MDIYISKSLRWIHSDNEINNFLIDKFIILLPINQLFPFIYVIFTYYYNFFKKIIVV
jgi:hypothetical protein